MIQKNVSIEKSIDSETCCVLFFLRLPELGKVKTRLAATLSDVHALELYKCFILDELATIKHVASRICVCCTPPDAQKILSPWLGAEHWYCVQKGKDLGARMGHAFEQAFLRGYKRVLLLGSDIPDLPVTVLEEGFAALVDHDACLASSEDGGYYCIGFTSAGYCPNVFHAMAWSTSEVCSQTRKRIEKGGHSLAMLLPWSDVDTRQDLELLCQRIGPDDAPYTRSYLKKSGIWNDLAEQG